VARFFDGGWREIVLKNQVLDTSAELSRRFIRSFDSTTPNLGRFRAGIFAYDGSDQPMFIMDKDEKNLEKDFRAVCVVEADLSGMNGALISGTGPFGAYWFVRFFIVFKFGATELRASMRWSENGVQKTSKASIIPVSQV